MHHWNELIPEPIGGYDVVIKRLFTRTPVRRLATIGCVNVEREEVRAFQKGSSAKNTADGPTLPRQPHSGRAKATHTGRRRARLDWSPVPE